VKEFNPCGWRTKSPGFLLAEDFGTIRILEAAPSLFKVSNDLLTPYSDSFFSDLSFCHDLEKNLSSKGLI
jgi:hypothetical protein